MIKKLELPRWPWWGWSLCFAPDLRLGLVVVKIQLRYFVCGIWQEYFARGIYFEVKSPSVFFFLFLFSLALFIVCSMLDLVLVSVVEKYSSVWTLQSMIYGFYGFIHYFQQLFFNLRRLFKNENIAAGFWSLRFVVPKKPRKWLKSTEEPKSFWK